MARGPIAPAVPGAGAAARIACLLGCAGAPGPAEPRLSPDDLPAEPSSLIALADELHARAAAPADFADELVALDRAAALGGHEFEVGWRVARACVGLADLAPGGEQRLAAARRGIEAAERAATLAPHRVEPFYYQALNLGLYARTQAVQSLDLVPRMEAAARAAIDKDERYDHGGPPRFLGLLYLRAPPWPLSIGDLEKAIGLLSRAAELAPEFPLNHLFLGQAHGAAGAHADAVAAVERAIALLAEPRWAALRARWQAEAAESLAQARELGE